MNPNAIIAHITDWLNAYAGNAGTRGFVVGVSGGIDSAVTSSLAARTGRPTLCLAMPIHQEKSQDMRAESHMARLGRQFGNLTSIRTDLTPVFNAFVQAMPAGENGEYRQLSLANTRSRIRMSTLHYFSGLHRYLVVGTGNKVEDFGVGFFTKYGDGGVDLSPIADLTKTEVYALGKALDIHEEIMTAKPTDGLWADDRSDEDQLGASYRELEWAMAYEADRTAGSGNLTRRQTEVLEIYRRFHASNRHKMVPIPVCRVPAEYKQDLRTRNC
ncbi:MAG: NAD(+) synthase [Gammaproteobacteria bacterium]|nr:NAD(+) synthase [Gammaproteobacteria bacterium]